MMLLLVGGQNSGNHELYIFNIYTLSKTCSEKCRKRKILHLKIHFFYKLPPFMLLGSNLMGPAHNRFACWWSFIQLFVKLTVGIDQCGIIDFFFLFRRCKDSALTPREQCVYGSKIHLLWPRDEPVREPASINTVFPSVLQAITYVCTQGRILLISLVWAGNTGRWLFWMLANTYCHGNRGALQTKLHVSSWSREHGRTYAHEYVSRCTKSAQARQRRHCERGWKTVKVYMRGNWAQLSSWLQRLKRWKVTKYVQSNTELELFFWLNFFFYLHKKLLKFSEVRIFQ